MSCPFTTESLTQLKAFIDLCTNKPELLNVPQLSFFKTFIESLGGTVPKDEETGSGDTADSSSEFGKKEAKEEPQCDVESDTDEQSDMEFDMTGVIEPDVIIDQPMGDPNKIPTEEEIDAANDKRGEAMGMFLEGNFDEAIKLYTEAIELNPTSALLLAKRGQVYLKSNRPNACIRDCDRALEINCDSAAAYKFRGRAHALLGNWENAAKDLREACRIDFDEQTDEWLREVTPNARKVEQHLINVERRKQEKELKQRLNRARKAKEANVKAASEAAAAGVNVGGDEMPTRGSRGVPPGMEGDIMDILNDPEIQKAFQDPEVANAFQDITANPANITKYQNNPKVLEVINKLSGEFKKRGTGGAFGGMGGMPPGMGAFGGMGGGFPDGAPTADSFPKKGPSDDDVGLD